jgi:hypothetical protein
MRWTLWREAGSHPPDETSAADGEVAWSWRRDPGATLAETNVPLATGARKAASPGRVRISRKTIARGKPGCLGCTCQTRVLSFATLAHGAAGASSARLSLRPLFGEGKRNYKTQVKSRRENESVCLWSPTVVIARLAAFAEASASQVRKPRRSLVEALAETGPGDPVFQRRL